MTRPTRSWLVDERERLVVEVVCYWARESILSGDEAGEEGDARGQVGRLEDRPRGYRTTAADSKGEVESVGEVEGRAEASSSASLRSRRSGRTRPGSAREVRFGGPHASVGSRQPPPTLIVRGDTDLAMNKSQSSTAARRLMMEYKQLTSSGLSVARPLGRRRSTLR